MSTARLALGIVLGSLASAADLQFSKSVYPVLEKAGCRSCHSSDGVASGTRLRFPEASVEGQQMEAFGRSLVALVNRDQPAQSVLLRKPTNQLKHAGGERIKPGSSDEAALRAWVNHLSKFTPAEVAAASRYQESASLRSNEPVLRRMTHSQYNNTVRDLLGELSQPASQFPPEDFVNGYKNQYQAQSLSPMLFEAYSAAAEKIARSALKRGSLERLIECRPSAACRAQFVRSFGLRAFRRPLTALEQKRYESLFAAESDFLEGARTTVEAFLQSPHFLFYLDSTPDPALKPYASASRLAYALWNSTPDAAMLTSAANGDLGNPQALERVVRRMLADNRAKEALDEFVSQWMRFDRATTAGKDRRTYPKFSRETALAMTEETRRFVADLVWNNQSFMELFTAEHGYINAELASLYGVPAPGKEFEKVKFPAESERAGVLGQALFLTLTGRPDDSSPTARGLFVREHFLCQHVPDPPPGVSSDLPPLNESKPQTNRQRLAMHTESKSCASCHNLIDPIGFGLEKFDAIGARREKAQLTFHPLDRKSKEKPRTVELDLDTAGFVAGIPNSDFSSPRGLGQILAASPQCQECMVKQYFRFVSGRQEILADRRILRYSTDRFRQSGFRFQDMMTALLVAREFPDSGAATVSQRQSSQ